MVKTNDVTLSCLMDMLIIFVVYNNEVQSNECK